MNLLFEHQAKDKICPIIYIGQTPGGYCVGSSCMMWRWAGERAEGDADVKHPVGYCGLSELSERIECHE